MWQSTFFDHWHRVVESGIDQHVIRSTVRLYKTMRSEWLSDAMEERAAIRAKEQDDEQQHHPMIDSQLMWLCLLVAGFGWAWAGLAFALELIWAKRNLKVLPFGE